MNIYITLTFLLEYPFSGCYTKDGYQWVLFMEVFLTCDDFENMFTNGHTTTADLFISAYCKKKSDRELLLQRVLGKMNDSTTCNDSADESC